MDGKEQKLALDFGQRYVIVWSEDGHLHRIEADYVGELEGNFWGFALYDRRILIRKAAVLKLEEIRREGLRT